MAEDYRRKCVANSLMVNIDNVAIETGCASIILISGMHRIWAHQFYESVGFNEDAVKGLRNTFIFLTLP